MASDLAEDSLQLLEQNGGYGNVALSPVSSSHGGGECRLLARVDQTSYRKPGLGLSWGCPRVWPNPNLHLALGRFP